MNDVLIFETYELLHILHHRATMRAGAFMSEDRKFEPGLWQLSCIYN